MGGEGTGALLRQHKVAIYDCPKIVGKSLEGTLGKLGYQVLFEGPLTTESAAKEADVWITKWTACLTKGFLEKNHPKKGILTLSVGTEHIDAEASKSAGIAVMNCPHYSSISVAEHAVALAMRSRFPKDQLPHLSGDKVIFANYSDQFADAVVSQILFRSRQLTSSQMRAKSFDYRRHDEPWNNSELSNLHVLIVGNDSSAAKLAHKLGCGFGSRLFGYMTDESLEAFDVKPLSECEFRELYKSMNYVVLCTDGVGFPLEMTRHVDTERFENTESVMTGSNVAILGTGRIGSRLAKIARIGFSCNVTAFSQSEKPDLAELGIRYMSSVSAAIREADFIFIALPLCEGTKSLIGEEELSSLQKGKQRTIINVTRDRIVDSGPMLRHLESNRFLSYATDVLPNDGILWQGGEPDETTRSFVAHPRVIATPHEGDCSRGSLERMLNEAMSRLGEILR